MYKSSNPEPDTSGRSLKMISLLVIVDISLLEGVKDMRLIPLKMKDVYGRKECIRYLLMCNKPQAYWLKTTMNYYFLKFCDLARWFFCSSF